MPTGPAGVEEDVIGVIDVPLDPGAVPEGTLVELQKPLSQESYLELPEESQVEATHFLTSKPSCGEQRAASDVTLCSPKHCSQHCGIGKLSVGPGRGTLIVPLGKGGCDDMDPLG